MPSIRVPSTSSEHGTHALVIGVSRYPYADGDDATDFGESSGLENLTSAARSASEFAAWLLTEYRNPDAPLKSLRVLFSPSEGEELNEGIQNLLTEPYAATSAAVREELKAFRDLCKNTNNVGIVYAAGHGIQLSSRGAILLLEDFAAEDQLAELEGAIDMVGCHDGMNGDGYAGNQFWFVDACRQLPRFARKFQSMTGALKLSEPVGDVHSSPIFLASSTRESAFAEIGGTSLFSQAVLHALRGAGAKGPPRGLQDWIVPVSRLIELLPDTVKKLAGAHGEDQRVDITGRVIEAVIHKFDGGPEVDLHLSLAPENAANVTTSELLFNGMEPLVPPPSGWPIRRKVAPGLYILKVNSQLPYKSAMKPLDIQPLEYTDTVKVN